MGVGCRWVVRYRSLLPIWRNRNITVRNGLYYAGGLEALRLPAAEACSGASEVSFEEIHLWEEMKHGVDQEELSGQKLFFHNTKWRRNRRRTENPELRHRKSKEALGIPFKPTLLESQLAVLDVRVDAGIRTHPGSSVQGASCRLARHEGNFECETCRKLCEDGPVTEAVDALDVLVERGCHVSNNLFYRVLKRCIAQKDLVLGRRLHALTIKSGYGSDAFLANHLICMYASHGRLKEAMRVFARVSLPDTHMWASMILAYARHGEAMQAIELYRQMRESTVKPDNHIFAAVLKACANAGDLAVGKDVHAQICASALKPDLFVQTGLIHMYAKCGMGHKALHLYNTMQEDGITRSSPVTYVCLLQACAYVGVAALHQGKQLHAQIKQLGLQADVVIGSSLVNMYAKCGSLLNAQIVFDTLFNKNVVTWTAMIAGYAQQGMGEDALSLYDRMLQEGITPPNSVTFVCLLQACASVGAAALQQGKRLHVQIEKRGLHVDGVVGNSLVTMYVKCGSLGDARQEFDRLPHRDVVAWNAMIAGYAQEGLGQEAFSLYSCMQQEGRILPDSVTFVCLLQACASVGVAGVHQGKQLHLQIEEQGLQADVVVGASLVNMYAKCGSLEDAQRVFDRIPQKDGVTWNAMIAGYAQQGMGQQALSLYSRMQQEGITQPDSFTFACLLQACASVAALPLGKQLHAQIEEQGLQADVVVGPSLVNMYAKCGSLEDAQQVFDSLPKQEIVAWGALMAGYARRGDSEGVFALVDRMRQEGLQPNAITFLSVLTVCSHVGLVEKGQKYFEIMSTHYGISPTIEHYSCMMDLLGRAGHLDEALRLVKTMPLEPNSAVWLTLLGACQKWSNVEVGRQAFAFAVRLDEKDAAAYVLMSNIYAGAQMWEEANDMYTRRVKLGAWKQLGQSCWTDSDGVLHTFVVQGFQNEERSICAATGSHYNRSWTSHMPARTDHRG